MPIEYAVLAVEKYGDINRNLAISKHGTRLRDAIHAAQRYHRRGHNYIAIKVRASNGVIVWDSRVNLMLG